MKQFLLAALLVISAPLAFAETPALDDVMSPAEIAAEVKQQNPEWFEESINNPNMIYKAAMPQIKVYVNKAQAGTSETAQTLWVYDANDTLLYTWSVSTGREKKENPPSGRKYFSGTPTGTWTPYGTTLLHKSRLWDADMPFSIWLTGGIAIHAASRSYESKLGQRASGGCIRLRYDHAQELYNLVQSVGRQNVQVTVFNK